MEYTRPQLDCTQDELEYLFNHYSDMVYRLALIRTHSSSDAEDVVQDVFLRCLRAKPAFVSDEHCKAWLLRVTLNCSKNMLGSAYRRHRVSDEVLNYLPAEQKESLSEVYDAVLALPQKYATAVHLHYYEGYSIKEIANLLGCTDSAVKSWLYRARALLKERLKGEF